MTYPARTAGRPNSQDEVGRDLIVRRTRAAIRDRPRTDLSRHEIAKFAGVTPALISYYFPDRSSLFEATITPILEDYSDDVRRVINSNRSLNDKLKGIIEVYLTFHYGEGYLLDFYVALAGRSGNEAGLKLLDDVQAEAVACVGALLDGQCLLGECPYAVQSALWGMCKQVARSGIGRSAGPATDESIAAETDLLYGFFMNGVALMLPVGPVLHRSQA